MTKRLATAATVAVLFAAGCAALKKPPTTPETQLALGGLRVAAAVGCDVGRKELKPADVVEVMTWLDGVVLPLVELSDGPGVEAELAGGGPRGLALRYLAPTVEVLRQYLRASSVVDRNATYWAGINAVVRGCRDAFVVPPAAPPAAGFAPPP